MSATDTNCAGILLEAARIAGGIRALARNVHVPTKQLTSWMEGEAPTPHTVFLRVLAFIGGRPA
jgi:hypothetical protein